MKKILYALFILLSIHSMAQHTFTPTIGVSDGFYVVHSGALMLVRTDTMLAYFSGGGSTPTLQTVIGIGNTVSSGSSIVFQNGGDLTKGVYLQNQDNIDNIVISGQSSGSIGIYHTGTTVASYLLMAASTGGSLIWPSGSFTSYIVRAVNGVEAGSDGNVIISASDVGALSFADTTVIATQFDVLNANASTFQYATPTTGQTVTANGAKYLVIDPAGSLLALTVAFPASPVNGQIFSISSTQVVTTLTLTSSGTVDGALTGIAANGTAGWIWVASITSWVKVHN